MVLKLTTHSTQERSGMDQITNRSPRRQNSLPLLPLLPSSSVFLSTQLTQILHKEKLIKYINCYWTRVTEGGKRERGRKRMKETERRGVFLFFHLFLWVYSSSVIFGSCRAPGSFSRLWEKVTPGRAAFPGMTGSCVGPLNWSSSRVTEGESQPRWEGLVEHGGRQRKYSGYFWLLPRRWSWPNVLILIPLFPPKKLLWQTTTSKQKNQQTLWLLTAVPKHGNSEIPSVMRTKWHLPARKAK